MFVERVYLCVLGLLSVIGIKHAKSFITIKHTSKPLKPISKFCAFHSVTIRKKKHNAANMKPSVEDSKEQGK